MAFLGNRPALYPYQGLLGLVAGFKREVTISELDADLFEESPGRFAASENPHIQ
jgi:hypothetical protein